MCNTGTPFLKLENTSKMAYCLANYYIVPATSETSNTDNSNVKRPQNVSKKSEGVLPIKPLQNLNLESCLPSKN